MLDVVLLAKVVLVGTLTAAAVMWLAAQGAPRPWRLDACWSWVIGAGILAASGISDQWPHWPPLEDRARFLTLLVPLTLAVETVAASLRSRAAVWSLRLSLAAVVAPILLFDSVYLADPHGSSAEWSTSQATIVLCALASLLAVVWAMLSRLESRTSTPIMMWVLALDALATAVTVMLSGYYRGGLLGLGLAAAIAGATLASGRAASQSASRGSLGMAVIGIFAVVLVGRFFGALSTALAACLLLVPLLAWTVELPQLRKLAPPWRSASRFAGVAMVLLVVVSVAWRKFSAASTARSKQAVPSAAGESIQK